MSRDTYPPHPLIDLDWIRDASGRPELSARECLLEQDAVGPNALFDPDFYRHAYGASMPDGMHCVEHFCGQTRDAPRDPNALFSVRQWHDAHGHALAPARWRAELFGLLGREARFARDELARFKAGQIVLHDQRVGPPPEAGQAIVLFAHHDTHGDIAPYVYDYLDALAGQDTCLLFVTQSAPLAPAAHAQLARRVWRIVQTRNRAHDWGLYHVGLRLLERDGFTPHHPLVLTNDSVVDTVNSLTPLFARARESHAVLTGAIDGWLYDGHLPSFFLYCSPQLVQCAAWRDFWAAWRPLQERAGALNGCEHGFSRFMRARGVPMQAVWTYEQILEAADPARAHTWRRARLERHGDTDPFHALWDVMLECGFPLLKRSVFTAPLNAHHLSHMTNVLSRLVSRRRARTVSGERA
ncbi:MULTISPECIES: hypothetical protein [Burkholderia]|uniref:hypothetical protein n=1 Tax=Burkholderia TaxID=32008 RepID=UPI000842153C|nr:MULTISPECIES: hypothetical protein [unclassified Burkholderia]AOK29067.1 hypothetical protein AQ611_06135 [Burkholderia sp. Bp7605]